MKPESTPTGSELYKSLNRDEVGGAMGTYFGGQTAPGEAAGEPSSNPDSVGHDMQTQSLALLPRFDRQQRDWTPPRGITVSEAIKDERTTENWLDVQVADAEEEVERQSLFMARGVMNPGKDPVTLEGDKSRNEELLQRITQKVDAKKQARRDRVRHIFSSRGRVRARNNISGQ